MRKKLIGLIAVAVAASGVMTLSAGCKKKPEPPKEAHYEQGDALIDEREGEFTVDQYGNITEKYTAKTYTVKYLVKDANAYVTLVGQKPTEMKISGYEGDLKTLSLKELEEEIVIEDTEISIVGISAGAFRNCETLETVDLTKDNQSLTFSIANGAFENCVSLKTVALPENIYTNAVAIGSRAFANNLALTEVTLGNKLTSIGESAFYNCISLTKVAIPENVSVIAANTFANCDKLSSIDVSASENLKSIQAGAFEGTAISNLDLSKLTSLRYIGADAFAETQLTSVNVPTSVSYIGKGAFVNCKKLANVNVPFLGNSIVNGATFNSIYGINDGEEDTRNISVTIDKAVTIPASAFESLKNIKSLTVKSFAQPGVYNVYSDNGSEFERKELVAKTKGVETHASSKTTIVKAVGGRAFKNCEKLETLNLPSDVEEIGDEAFLGCKVLAKFTLPATVEKIGESAFSGCKQFSFTTLPAALKEIGYNAFRGCTALTEVTIPASVTTIGRKEERDDYDSIIRQANPVIFYGCNNITSITVERLNGWVPEENEDEEVSATKIYNYNALPQISAWFGTPNYRLDEDGNTINEPCVSKIKVNSLYKTNASEFAGFENLTEVELTFKDVDKTLLEDKNVKVEEYDTTDSVIAASTFYNVKGLDTIKITDEDGILTEIGDYAFYGCEKVTAVAIPAGVKKIGEGALAKTGITSVTLPAALEEIGDTAFADTRITEIVIPEGVKTVGGGIVAGCTKLASVTVEAYNKVIENTDENADPFTSAFKPATKTYYSFGNVTQKLFAVNSSNYDEDTEYVTNNGYVIPKALKTVTLNKVTQLAADSFNGWEELTTLTIGFTETQYSTKGTYATTIGSSAFNGCKKLATLNITGGDKVKDIGNSAFRGCAKISNSVFASFTNLAVLGGYAFRGCEGLTSVTLPGTLTAINNNIFYDCPNITTLNVGNLAKLNNNVSRLFGATNEYVSDESEFKNETLRTQKYFGSGTSAVPVALKTVTVNGVSDLNAISSKLDNLTGVEVIAINLDSKDTNAVLETSILSGNTSLKKVYLPENLTAIYIYGGSLNANCELGNATVYNYVSNADYVSSYGNYWTGTTENPKVITDSDYKGATYTFNANGGTFEKDEERVATSDVAVESGALTADKLPTPEYEGKTFIGWFESRTGTASPVSFPYYKNGYNRTLYARWLDTPTEKDAKLIEYSKTYFAYDSDAKVWKTTFGEVTDKDTGTKNPNYGTANFTYTAWEDMNVDVELGLSYATGSGRLSLSKEGSTVFYIDNSSLNDEAVELNYENHYSNSKKKKTVTVSLKAGESFTVSYRLYSDAYYNNNISVKVTVKNYTAPVVPAAPTIPTANIPVFDFSKVSGLIKVKGTSVTDTKFTTTVNTLKNLSTKKFNAHLIYANGLDYNIDYDMVNRRAKLVTNIFGSSTTMIVDNRYGNDSEYREYNAAYLKLPEAAITEMEEMLKKYEESGELSSYELRQAKEQIEQFKTKYVKLTGKEYYYLDFADQAVNNNLDTDIENFEFDTASGSYWKKESVYVNGSSYTVVRAYTISADGDLTVTIAVFNNYNELEYYITYSDFGKTMVTLPSSNEVIDMNNMQ